MARIRTIKPEFWKHEDLSALPEITHMLAAALLNHADDEGYFNANPALVRAECLPLREPSVSTQDSLRMLAEIGFIQIGQGEDGKRYGRVVKFDEHQRVNRPTPSKIKAMHIVWEGSMPTHTQLSEASPPERNREQGREEEQGTGNSSLRSESSAPLALTSPNPPADLTTTRAARIQQIAEDAREAYNRILAKPAGNLPACSVLNKPRLKAVEKCLPTARLMCKTLFGNERVTPKFWQDYFDEVALDDFHAGRQPGGPGHENWKPDFEFLLRETVMAKLFDRAMTEAAA
ncbi:hypothetical protein PQS31_01740 [Luteimonas sp BLCC-B24]|uniref:hypothetical protein n=1 Tax=Luteimonas sp. BLCC-B24 TaxID=3025317 RepID=UPI00234DE9F7|nr:hypothetical protein [Luteimonas sp. BLCC-B24]MDC7805553.1 hypothetical protein [Luteimonas sp. BLCC-B24]